MNEIWIVMIKGIIAAVVPSLVTIHHFQSREPKQQSKSYYGIVLTTLFSICFQFLVYIGGFWGDPVPIIIVGGLTSAIAFMLVIFLQPKSNSGQPRKLPESKSFLLMILLFNMLVPVILAIWFVKECDDRHRQLATPLINAITEYKGDTGHYPKNLQLVIPDYLTEIPAPKCFSIYQPFVPIITNPKLLRSIEYPLMMKMLRLKKIDYHLMDCSVEENGVLYEDYYLVVFTFDFRNEQRYYISEDYWQTFPLSYGCGVYSSRQRFEFALTSPAIFPLSSFLTP